MKEKSNETKICKHCQTEIPKKAKVCPQCRKKVKGGKLKWILIIVVALLALMVVFGEDAYELSEDAESMSKEEYIDSCEKYTYEEIARNAESFVGKKIKFKGEIQQVVYDSEDGSSEYLISVTEDEFGLWTDNVYVTLVAKEDDSKFLDYDIVAFYGEVSGEEEYTSILGENIVIPSVTAVYMNLEK